MNFRQVKANVVSLLSSGAAGRFSVVGFAAQANDQDQLVLPSVQVYYQKGEFSYGRNPSVVGPFSHELTLRVEIGVAAAASMDLTVIATGDGADIIAALAAMKSAAGNADDKLDEAFENVYQIIMDPRNKLLGFTKGTISNVWIGEFVKDNPLPRGEYVILNGSADITCIVSEDVTGDIPEAGGFIDTCVDIIGDDVERTGVLVEI